MTKPSKDVPRYAWNALRAVHEEAQIHIDPQTAATHWAGERMDYGVALLGLFNQRDRKRFRGYVESSA